MKSTILVKKAKKSFKMVSFNEKDDFQVTAPLKVLYSGGARVEPHG